MTKPDTSCETISSEAFGCRMLFSTGRSAFVDWHLRRRTSLRTRTAKFDPDSTPSADFRLRHYSDLVLCRVGTIVGCYAGFCRRLARRPPGVRHLSRSDVAVNLARSGLPAESGAGLHDRHLSQDQDPDHVRANSPCIATPAFVFLGRCLMQDVPPADQKNLSAMRLQDRAGAGTPPRFRRL